MILAMEKEPLYKLFEELRELAILDFDLKELSFPILFSHSITVSYDKRNRNRQGKEPFYKKLSESSVPVVNRC